MIILRNYQEKGVNNIRNSYIQKYRAPLFVLATGGGKTVIFCHIAQQTSLKGKNVLILVHRVELLRQTSKSLTKSGVEHGLINPKFTPNPIANVQVASVQTLVKRLDKIQPPDLIIIDEAHHATAGSWRKVTDYYSNAKLLGVTATPIRADGKGLDSIFDCLVLGPQTKELIQMGYLVQPIIYAPPVTIDLSSVKIVRGDYDTGQVVDIIDQPTITGSAVEHYKKLCPGVPSVVFCVSVKHAEHVAEDFRQHGFKAYSVDGAMDDDTRSRILNGLGDGSIEVVTSCDLISEGTDIPAIGCAILLRPTQSTGLYIQQVGRALRLSEGKNKAIILDHVGNVMRHGFPDDIREWTLQGRKKNKRGPHDIDDEKDVNVQQCESCFAVHEPALKCPYCGFENVKKHKSPREIEGELIQIEQETEIRKKLDKQKKKDEVRKARTIEDLLVIQKDRGYKNGWARMIFEKRKSSIM